MDLVRHADELRRREWRSTSESIESGSDSLIVEDNNLVRESAVGTKLVLLGTKGGPRVSMGRSSPASLLVASNSLILVDCGYGVTRQLIEAGMQPHDVRSILITHHHSDHILELGPFIYNAWIGGAVEPIDVWGPPPLQKLVDGFFRSMAHEINTRVVDEGRVDLRDLVRVHEFLDSGLISTTHGVTITATKVRHPPLTYAYAYRFDTLGRSIVLSGDTTYSPELITFANGADVLLHEVMHLRGVERLIAGAPHAVRLREHLLASHTTTEQVGRVAAEAEVKTLVLNHFVPGDDPSITDEMWTADSRELFHGAVLAGRDLQII